MYDLEHAMMRFIQKLIEILHEVTLSEAEALVFDSRKTLEQYRRLYSDILRGKALEVIPPGVEIDQFKYVPPIKKDYFEILTVGYLLKRKGIQYLIYAMPAIVKENEHVRLKVVGSGPCEGELVKLVKELHLEEHVKFVGYVPRQELPMVYAGCDVYVQPSLSETFPSSIREAMSTGRPIVGTFVGFIDEHIREGFNGFFSST
jgi:glycosyltransferase involved in cell wall biosynthesis